MKTQRPLVSLITSSVLAALICVGCMTDHQKSSPAPSPVPQPLVETLALAKEPVQVQQRGRHIPDIKVKPDFKTEAMDALQFVIICNWVAARAHVTKTFDGDELDLINPDKLDLKYFADHMNLVNEAEGFIKDLFANRKLEGDRRIQKRIHDKRMKDAIFASAPNPVAIVSGKDWKAIGFVLAQSAFSVFMNYRRLRSEEELRYEQVVWDLDKNELDIVEDFMMAKFRNESAILGEFKIDGKYLVGKDALEELVKQIEQNDSKQLFFYLKNPVIEKKFLLVLPYWYYRGITDVENGDRKDALDAFYTFQALHRPILKHDRMAALVAQNIIMLLDENDKGEIASQIRKVVDNADTDDWDVRLFAATILSNVLGKQMEALNQLDAAVSVEERKYRDESAAYISKLKKEKKLRYKDNGTRDSKDRIVNTIPPSQDILFQLRSARHLISQRIGQKEVESFLDRTLENPYVSPSELFWHLATLQNKYGKAKPSISRKIDEKLDTARSIFVDYNYSDDFRCEVPLSWIDLSPENITFVMQSTPNPATTNAFVREMVKSATDATAAPSIQTTVPWAVASAYLFRKYAALPLAAARLADAFAGYGSGLKEGCLDILEVVPSYSLYYYKGPVSKKPSFYFLFEGDDVGADRADITTYTLHFDYPGFGIDFYCQDSKGQTSDIEWGDLAPTKLTLRIKEDGFESSHEIPNPDKK